MATKQAEIQVQRRALYPWRQWWKSKVPLVLVRGVDYFCKTNSMDIILRTRARTDQVEIKINKGKDDQDRDVLTVTIWTEKSKRPGPQRGKRGKVK